MEEYEIKAAIGEASQKHGILIYPDDPLLVSITLVETVFRRLVEQQNAAIATAQDQIAAGTAKQLQDAEAISANLITKAAEYMAGELRQVIEAHKQELLVAATAQKREMAALVDSARAANRHSWYGALTVIAVACTIAGVTIGMMLDLPPVRTEPAPRPGIAAWHR